MIRLVIYLALSLLAALGVTWLISLPGTVDISAPGWRLTPSLGTAIFIVLAVIAVAILIWGIVRRILGAPSAIGRANARRREKSGIDALSDSMIALQAGEFSRARMLARDARSKLPENPAAQLLEARAELALGDLSSAREHYRGLIANERTALAALTGLYEQARAQNRDTAAITFARKALTLSPSLDWASEAVFDDMASRGAWADALEMSNSLPARTRAQKAAKKRRQGILETALAQAEEETAPDSALDHAGRALKAIPDFVPAALIAARTHINKGDTRRASALLRRTWRATFHPDVATLYAHAKPGSSAVERLKRMRNLVENPHQHPAAAMVLARAAIDAYEWSTARNALAPHIAKAPTRTMCMLMAEIEEGQSGDQGKAREWLSRAVRAPQDPAWTADGVTSEDWAPASPVTHRLDAFEWKVPVHSSPAPLSSPQPNHPPAAIEADPANQTAPASTEPERSGA